MIVAQHSVPLGDIRVSLERPLAVTRQPSILTDRDRALKSTKV